MMKEEYTKDRPLRVFTAFSGYDSQCMALERLGIPYVLVGWSEIDKYAIQAHDALFPEAKDKNFGDISKIDWNKVPDFDLFTYSFPCTNLSCAGKQEGCEENSGTASSLLWECRKTVMAKKPKYLLMENVKALVSQKFLPYFRKWQDELSKRGYSNFVKVLNSKCYGIPQNRERVFMVSILDEDASFHFPEPFPLKKRLKDVLEEEVDERYYLKDDAVSGIMGNLEAMRPEGEVSGPVVYDDYNGRITGDQSVMGTVTPNCGTSAPRNGYKIIEPRIAASQGRYPKNPSDRKAGCPTEQRLEIGGDISNTVTTVEKDCLVVEPAILTPKRNEYGKAVRKKYEAGEIQESRHNMTDLVPREDGICNTITSVQKDYLVLELIKSDSPQPKIIQRPRGNNKGGVYEICPTISSSSFEYNNQIVEIGNVNPSGKGMNGRVVSDEGIAPTLSTNKGEGIKILPSEAGFRIRKLSEREIFRLMDVSEDDIDRIQAAGISRSQQYKMAGNSIVTNVLYHIFRKMFIDTECESEQLSIF